MPLYQDQAARRQQRAGSALCVPKT